MMAVVIAFFRLFFILLMTNKNKTEIEAEFKRKSKKLLDLNKAYFEKDRPKVSDLDFDNLKNELVKLSKIL